jgi:hypothetical protein
MGQTSFDPVKHGFHFDNSFVNHVLFDLITTNGLCGGMADSSLDYFYAGIPIPTHTKTDFGAGNTTPPEGSRLRDYIFGRMMDTIVDNLGTWTRVAIDPFFNPVQFTKKKLPELLGTLDLGRPMPLGLIKTRNLFEIGSNHQVVVFGYELSNGGNTVKLFIYDNNFPNTTVTLTTNPNNPESITYSAGVKWIGFFMENYQPKTPTYIDLGLATGLTLAITGAESPLVQGLPPGIPPSLAKALDRFTPFAAQLQFLDKPLTARYSVQNFGEFPAHLTALKLPVLPPDGPVSDTELGSIPVSAPVQPGGTLQIEKTAPAFGTVPGQYEITAEYTSAQGKSIRLPRVGPNTRNRVEIGVVPAGTNPTFPKPRSVKLVDATRH